MIIAVTGTPGTGKTEAGKELARILGYAYVDLNALAKKHGAYCGYDGERQCPIVDMGMLDSMVKGMGHDLVLDSHYSHELACDVVVVLRCGIAELRGRLERKGFSARKIRENIEAEMTEVCKSEAFDSGKRVIEQDTTGMDAETVAKLVALRLRRPRKG